jgi:putative SOS response-associated peptidase YedK
MCGRFGLTRDERELAGEFVDLNRLSVIFPCSSLTRWLDPEVRAIDVAELLASCPDDWLSMQPASSLVNNPRNEGPEFLHADVASSGSFTC